MRLESDVAYNQAKPKVPNHTIVEHAKHIILDRIEEIDPEEASAALDRMDRVLSAWRANDLDCWSPRYKRDKSYADDLPLMYSAGSHKNRAWGKAGIKTPTSMRSVDAACEAAISSLYESQEE